MTSRKPNGIAISPDHQTLYVADHNNGTDRIDPTGPKPKLGSMKVYAFPLGPDGLVNGPRRTLVDFGDEEGSDGMTVDTEGRIYLASRRSSRPGVLVVDPTGKEVALIKTGEPQQGAREPVGIPSNVDFGIGGEKNVLYITVNKSLFRIRLNATGYHIPLV
jgi:sugar lactone lactonase YvrE